MVHLASLMLVALVIFSALTRGQKQAPPPCIGTYPMEPSVIGKEAYGIGGCSPGGQQSDTVLKSHTWGMYFSPLFYFAAACWEEIVFAYTKSDRPSMTFYRPFTTPKFFATTHPNCSRSIRSENLWSFHAIRMRYKRCMCGRIERCSCHS